MASTNVVRKISGLSVMALPLLVGCSDTLPDNDLSGSASGTNGNATAATTNADTAADAADTEADTMADADTTAGGGEVSLPATYRFDCMDIIALGDSNKDGQPDGDAIQATLLENTWSSDIAQFKLNVLLTVHERDDDAGTAVIGVGSGIGMSNADQCVESTSASPKYMAGFNASAAAWQPGGADGACVEPAVGNSFGGTYTLELAAEDTVYIYAQDDDGTEFNCVPGGGAPNAVPLHAIVAEVTVDTDNNIAGGTMTGCLLDSEAQNLCSCLGECTGTAHEDCGGCPDGATPLGVLIGGVGPTDNCTEIMGAPAYDFTAGFTTVRLSDDEPNAC